MKNTYEDDSCKIKINLQKETQLINKTDKKAKIQPKRKHFKFSSNIIIQVLCNCFLPFVNCQHFILRISNIP